MKRNKVFRLIALAAVLLFAFSSCNGDDPVLIEAKITAFSITNAGGAGNENVNGVIEGQNILVTVPFETDVTALTTNITLSAGATVTPASGTPQDFTNPRNFVVINGALTNPYVVTVIKASPTSGVITAIEIKSSVSNAVYPTVINQGTKQISVTFNQLQSPSAIITDITILPAGATYTTSGDGNNLNLSTAQTITVSFAGTNTVYNVVPTVTPAGFNPANTTTLIDKSAKSNLVPSAIDNELTRSAAFDGRYVYVAARKDGNFVYAWDSENPTANPAELNFGGIVAGGSWVVSDVRCEGGKIFVSNMVMNKDQVFKVYKWNSKDDSAPTLILEYTVPGDNIRLGDAISIIGNPPENGYIFASNFAWPNNASEFYVWNFNGKKNPTPTILPIVPTTALRMGQYGRVSAIPGDPSKLLLAGAEIPLAVINFSGTFLYEATEPMIQSRSFDPRIFQYNDGLYLSYVVNREWEGATADDKGVFYEVINISEGANIVEALSNLNNNNIAQKRVFRHNFGGATAASWVGATHQVGFGANGRPRAMSFGLRNGFIVHQFSN